MTDLDPGEGRLLDALADGIILIEGERIAYSNPAAAALLGAPVPDTIERLVPASLAHFIEQAAATQGRTTIELGRGAPTRWIEAVAEPVGLLPHSQVVVLRDITERRRVEVMRRDFVANASHELKTPVASIQAAAETLLRALDEDVEAARHFARQVHATAGRLAQLVRDLLDLSRLETEQPTIQEVDLGRLVAKEADRLADRAEVLGIDLTIRVEPVVAEVSRPDVRLAIRNLLENAFAYSKDGDAVTVVVDRQPRAVVIAVSDSGEGIPGRDVPRIFERFYRVDSARNRQTGGTGLGLAIVRHVAEEHGGSVEVDSELGVGSTFRLRLPLVDTPEVRSP